MIAWLVASALHVMLATVGVALVVVVGVVWLADAADRSTGGEW